MEVIRVASPENLQACLRVRHQVFVLEQHIPASIEVDGKDVLRGESHHLLLADEGKPVATGRWYFQEEGVAKFQRIAVLETHRNRGLGKRIMDEMERQAMELGAASVVLDAQLSAKRFYDRLGYAAISGPFREAGIEHLRMKKPL
ncbi:GNAT family N-acetyltransferase [Paenibacillus sp. MWE-103]|uniref:GNAT family N-acetyltransferase n=1 Tax=Paenibacillus artemisiicola TaxID=1172618 RepID=A0ABS3W854_9BACL|nr:GNAT family N-acetyltransferase [Paenibacillus artemisiicola]MBO7744310.1 GNAT family N-acetyltransferase [Paenibacillus artemisiicola]